MKWINSLLVADRWISYRHTNLPHAHHIWFKSTLVAIVKILSLKFEDRTSRGWCQACYFPVWWSVYVFYVWIYHVVYFYHKAGCCCLEWSPWPGFEQTLQAAILSQIRLKLTVARGSRERLCLINKSESRGPPLLGIFSSFTRAWLLLHPWITQRASASEPSPEALHMKMLLSVLLLYPAVFLKTKWKKRKKPNDSSSHEKKGGKVNLQQKAFVLSDSHVQGAREAGLDTL